MSYRPRRSLPSFVLGSLAFVAASKQCAPPRCRPRFPARWRCADKSLPPVVFVLGGPGSGKGTQCGLLIKEFDAVQVTAGDLLRREAESDSQLGQEIAETIRTGGIVPGHVTIGLLREELKRNASTGVVLIDGFPRAMDQAVDFEEAVKECEFVLFFNCDVKEMVARLLKRGETSGRVDDNAEVIEKRLKTYMEKTLPVLKYYGQKGKLKEIDATVGDADQVYKITRSFFEDSPVALSS